MESKKIKKLEKVNRNSSVRFKKTLLKPSRAPTGQIDRPPRLDDESEVHLLESVSYSLQFPSLLPYFLVYLKSVLLSIGPLLWSQGRGSLL